MIELTTTVIEQQNSKVLALLQSKEILIFTENRCVKITAEKSETVDELVSNHKDADTKVVLHCMHAQKDNRNKMLSSDPHQVTLT